MKFLFTFLFSFLLLHSCSGPNSKVDIETCGVDDFGYPVKSMENITTHFIDIQCEGGFIPLRNRILSKSELRLSQNGTDAANRLNDNVIIKRLYNGEWVKLLKADTLGYHYVQVIDRMNSYELSENEQRNLRGFIISKFCGKPTLRTMEKINISTFDNSIEHEKSIKDFLNYHNPNGDLLDYAYAYISNEAEFIQVLSFSVNGINEIHYKLYVIVNQRYHLLFNGNATLYNSYQNENGKLFTRYIPNKFLGHNFEIHFCEEDNITFLRIKDIIDPSVYPAPDEVIMQRIK